MSNTQLDYEKAYEVVNKKVMAEKSLKFVETEAKTGFSYFAGKKRLCKLLKTKKGISLELNVELPKELTKDNPNFKLVSADMAHKKHLGTMKSYFRTTDMKELTKVITAAIQSFKESNNPVEAKETK